LFLQLRELKECWRIRETMDEELISVLFGQHANVEWVALDPIPEIGGEVLIGIVSSMTRELRRASKARDGVY
jgi:hypothetical protein